MSRQAGPSIVLSVLIVSFFAIALFQQDFDRTRAGRSRSTAHKLGDGSPPPGPLSTPSNRSRSMVHSSQVIKPAGMSAVRADGPQSPSDIFAAKALANSTGDTHEIRRGGSSKARGTISPIAYGQEVLPGLERPLTSVKAGGGAILKPSFAIMPRSAFTVALPSETIEDVSGRVYGTAELADSLWRANRDTLPKRDSPLSAGMLLRTPRIE
jgi:hypothetical protein